MIAFNAQMAAQDTTYAALHMACLEAQAATYAQAAELLACAFAAASDEDGRQGALAERREAVLRCELARAQVAAYRAWLCA